jgi:hypothetical protein
MAQEKKRKRGWRRYEKNGQAPKQSSESAASHRLIDDIRWIIQHRSGKQWRSHSFHRERQWLVRCLEPGFPVEAIMPLPEHHDDPADEPLVKGRASW